MVAKILPTKYYFTIHLSSFGRDANAGIALIAFLPGGLYVCTGVRWSDGPARCAFLWNGQVGVNPQNPS